MKEYYDIYLKKENEEKCKICKSVCNWDGSTKGYRTYCSKICMESDQDYKDIHRKGVNSQDKLKAMEKRKQTCIKKYGVEYVSQNPIIKEKTFATNISNYGSRSSLNAESVKLARIKALNDNIDQINIKRKNWWASEGNISKVNKTRIDTMLEVYGIENLLSTEEMKNIIRNTNYESGHWIPLEQKSDWEQYCFKVKKETKKHINELFDNWNGKCFYFNHKLDNEHSSYEPYSITIDHKISKKHGFVNNILPEIIGSLTNLCICSRIVNCIKNSLTEEEFYKSERYIKYKESLSE